MSTFPSGGGGMTQLWPQFEGSSTIEIVDIDGDGFLDVITAKVSIFLGDGTGALGPASALGVSGHFDVGDLNGDGNLDIFVGGTTGTTVIGHHVLLNAAP